MPVLRKIRSRFGAGRFGGGRFGGGLGGIIRAVVNGLQTVGAYPNSFLYGTQGAISVEVEGVVQTNVDYGSTEGANDLASGVTNPPDVDAFDTHDPINPFIVYWSVPGTDYAGSFAFRHAVPGINADPTIAYASGDRPRLGAGANWSGVGFGNGGGEWFIGGARADNNPGTQVVGATAIGAGTTFQTPPNAAHEGQPIWFRQFNPSSGGIAYAWSEFVIGPDLTADTVSLVITYDNTNVSIVATTSDEGTLHTVLADPANAPSAAQVLLGQDGTGSAAPYYNNSATISVRGEQAPVDVPGMSGDIAAYSVLVDSNANESNLASTPTLDLDTALPPTATSPRQAPIMRHNNASSQIEFLSFGAAVENGATNTRRLYINDVLYTQSVWVVPYSALTAGDVVRGETVYTNANGTYVNESNSVTYQGEGFAAAHAILTDAHAGTTPGFYAVAGDSTRDNPVDDSQMMQRYYPRQIGKINNLTLIDNAGYGQSTQNWAGDVASPHVGDLITAISGTGATTIVELSLGINDPVSVALIKDRLFDGFARLISERPDAVVVPVVPSTTGNAGENANLRQSYAEFAQELGLPLIDTAPGMDAVYDFGSGDVFYSDDKHPTTQGSARLIHIIMDALMPVSLRSVMTIDDMHREPGDGIPAQPLSKADLLAGLSLNLATDNTAPVAVDDAGFTTPFETAILLDLLANDTDLNGDDLTLQSVSNPVGGTVVITDANAGTATFTPATGFDGAASFDYVVTDGTDTDTGSVSGTVAAEVVVPEMENLTSLGQTNGDLDVTGTMTAEGLARYVLTASATVPSVAQITAGQDHTGAPALDADSFTAANGNQTYSLPLVEGLDGSNYYLHLNTDGSSDVDTIGPLTLDTTDPVLSGLAVSNITQTTADLAFTTSEGGTAFWGIYPSASTPSSSDVQNGFGGAVSGTAENKAVVAGAVTDDTNSLLPNTSYRLNVVVVDAQGNESAVLQSAAFTTLAAASGVAITPGAVVSLAGGAHPVVGDFTRAAAGDAVFVVNGFNFRGEPITAATFGGVALSVDFLYTTADNHYVCILHGSNLPTGTNTLSLTFNGAQAPFNNHDAQLFEVSGGVPQAVQTEVGAGAITLSESINMPLGGAVIAGANCQDLSTRTAVWTGATDSGAANSPTAYISDLDPADASRDVDVSFTGAISTDDQVLMVLPINPS